MTRRAPKSLHDSFILYYVWLVTLTLAISSALAFEKFNMKIRKTLLGETAYYVSMSFLLWGVAVSFLMLPSMEKISDFTGIFLGIASLASLMALRSAYSMEIIQGILAPDTVGQTGTQETRILKDPSTILCGLAFLVGSVGVLRFVLNYTFLNEMMEGMSISTGLGFVFIAVPLILSVRPKFSIRLLYMGAGLTFILAFAALIGHRTGVQVLYAPLPGGGMSISTAIGLILLCIWGASMKWQGLKSRIARLVLSVCVLLIAIFAVLGYIFNISTLYSVGSFARLSVPTAMCFILIGMALFWRAWRAL